MRQCSALFKAINTLYIFRDRWSPLPWIRRALGRRSFCNSKLRFVQEIAWEKMGFSSHFS